MFGWLLSEKIRAIFSVSKAIRHIILSHYIDLYQNAHTFQFWNTNGWLTGTPRARFDLGTEGNGVEAAGG